jgi:hypothetical protein
MELKDIVNYVIALGIAIVGFFLKRSYNQMDKQEARISELEEAKASKEDFEKLGNDIACIKKDYITKEDFFREQAKTDRKLDRIYDILLEIKGGNKQNG